MNTALEYSTRVVQEGGRRCKKSTLNDLVHLTPLRIPLMNPGDGAVILKGSHRMGVEHIFLNTSAPLSLMTTYRMSLISAGFFLLDSTFNYNRTWARSGTNSASSKTGTCDLSLTPSCRSFAPPFCAKDK
jgi:hypothetical protein